GDLGDRVAASVAERRPGLNLVPRVRARVVDLQVLTVDRDLHVDVDVLVTQGVVVDVGVALVDAVGPARHLLAEATRRVVDHVVNGLLDSAGAIAVDDLAQATGRQLGRADLGPQVTQVAG